MGHPVELPADQRVLIGPALERRERLAVDAPGRIDAGDQPHRRAQPRTRRADLAEGDRVGTDHAQQDGELGVELISVLARTNLGREVERGP